MTVVVGSILLVLVATALFVAGLYRGSDPMYYSSIVASVVAAAALVVGVRRGRSGHRAVPAGPGPRSTGDPYGMSGLAVEGYDEGAVALRDEPAEQATSPAAAALVARLDTPVAVIDGRPRYHLPRCLHLLGRPVELVAVHEVVELGFTPCGQCEPVTALLERASRR